MNYLKESTKLKKNPRKLMKLNEFIGKKTSRRIIEVCYIVIGYLLTTYLINAFFNITGYLKEFSNPGKYFGLSNFIINLEKLGSSIIYQIVYIGIMLMIVISVCMLDYKLKTYIGYDAYNKGQKGSERWTTLQEIREQYKEIPEKTFEYPGHGGIPVCRYEDKIYIDDSPSNNLIIGITRSGKGEMFVYPTIDIYSRAEFKPSLVITDLKLDEYPSCYDTLVKRGYDVYLFNLIEPLYSCGFNPLELIVEAYERKDYSGAELLCTSYAYSIFNPGNAQSQGNDKFWANNGVNGLSACILAIVEDCFRKNEEDNKRREKIWKQRKMDYESLEEEEQEEAKKHYYSCLKDMEEGKKKGDILDYVFYIPSDIEFSKIDLNNKYVNMFSIIYNFSNMAQEYVDVESNMTKLDVYFLNRGEMDRARLRYSSVKVAGDRTKGSIFSTILSELAVFMDEEIAKMTAESSFNLRDVGFGDKPVAIFIGLPEYDQSKHFLASVFIRQLYYILAKTATQTRMQKCKREVVFYLAEFGNLPAIENMVNLITMGLSRNIRFILEVQSYSQINKIYGDDADGIIGNCANQVYIQTSNPDTAKHFSSLLGNETTVNVTRMGEKLSLKKNITESFEERPLLNDNQLMGLQEGENVIMRVMKRRDLKGRSIAPDPIFNSLETGTAFKRRFEYMLSDFPDGKIYRDIPIETRDNIDIYSRIWKEDDSFSFLSIKEVKDLQCYGSIISILETENFIDMEGYELDDIQEMQQEEFKELIVNSVYLKEMTKSVLLKLVEKG